MAYTRTNWESGVTPLSAGNMNNIEDGIEELNSNIGTTRFVIPSSISGALGVLAYGFKDNATGTVRIYFAARFSSNVNTNTSMFSVPEGYRPSVNDGGPCLVVTDTGAASTGYVIIGTDGTIKQTLTGYCRGISGFAEYQV